LNDISTYKIEAQYTQYITTEQAWHYRIVPYHFDNKLLKIYADETTWDNELLNELEILIGLDFELAFISNDEMNKMLAFNFRKSGNKSMQVQVHTQKADRFVFDLIAEAHSLGSSDIHIEILEEHARVRIRLDGNLVEKYKFAKTDYAALINKIKIKAFLDIAEKRLPQDGRIQYSDDNRKFDIRVSILPTLHGEKIVLRILSSDADSVSIDSLGLTEDQKASLLEGIRRTSGILLVSGPTGSGKTTTLYAALKILNEEKRNILTVEDPIEYTLNGINQVQLKESIGLTFSSTLRSFLRQDPDVIMVGEIRDKETAIIAIRAALTGHLVLSTIHTNSAWGTISRLIEMGIPSYLLAGTLNTTIAQRLIRVLCSNCKKQTPFDSSELPRYFQTDIEIQTVYKATGCPECHYTGYTGRKAVYEVIPIDRELSALIKENKSDVSLELNERNINTLAKAAFDLLQNGYTSLEEVYPILIQSI
jgi:general secretion pathway protein E/type IV pilus assembly protein PilB